MLLPPKEKKEKTYYVECANWKSLQYSNNPMEAATEAFEEVLCKYKKKTEVSPVITVLDLTTSMQDITLEDNIHFVYTPTVLANAGLHSLSSNFQDIIDNLKQTLRE